MTENIPISLALSESDGRVAIRLVADGVESPVIASAVNRDAAISKALRRLLEGDHGHEEGGWA